MASEDYLPLFWKARREHLGNIQRVSEEIIKLYREAAADLAARAAASREGSLSERWASEYARSLEQRVKELEAELYDVTLQGLKRSAELPASAMGQWWEMVGGQSFRDAFATTPDNVLAGLIEGGFYRDRKGLSERIWRVAQGFEKDVGYIVQRGIAEKKSVAELAADLEQYVKAPAKRDFDWGKVYPNLSGKKVDFNAQRLARTSINHAYFLDNVKVCTENPFVESMHWDLSNAHEERQVIPFGPDECDEYAEHDEGLGLGNFKPEEIPVPHPQCLCVQWAVIPDSLEDIGARIGAWASGETDELLDEWYDKYGNQNPNGDSREILREGLKYQSNGGIMYSDSSDVFKSVTSESYRNIDSYSFFGDNRDSLLRAAFHEILNIVKNYAPGIELLRVYSVNEMNILGEKLSETEGKVGAISTIEDCITIHNHASGGTFSIRDLDQFTKNENVKAILVIGHNGNIYSLKKEDNYIKEDVSLTYLCHYKMINRFSDDESMLRELEKYGATYKETN